MADSYESTESMAADEALLETMKEKLPPQHPSFQPLPFSQACKTLLKNTRVAVVGGGLGGLMAALRLGQHGISVTVYEARPQVGGRVLSNRKFFNGRVIEEGAELIGSFHNEWLALAQRYGLAVISRMDDRLYELAGLKLKLRLNGDTDLSMNAISALGDGMGRIMEHIAQEASKIQDATKPWAEPRLRIYDGMSVAYALENFYGVQRGSQLWKAFEFLLVNNEVAPLEEMNFLGLLCKVKGGQSRRFGTGTSNSMGYWEELEIFRCADGCQRLAEEIAREIKAMPGCKIVTKTAVTYIGLHKRGVKLATRNVIWPGGKAGKPNHPLPMDYEYVILAIPPTVWDGVKITVDGKDAHPKNEIGLMGMGPAVKFFSAVKKRFWIKEKAAPSGGSLKLGQVWEGTDNQTQTGSQGIVLNVFAGPILPGPHGRRTPTPQEFQNGLRALYPGYTANKTGKILFRNWPSEPFIKTGYASPRKGQIFTVGKKLNEPFHGRLFFTGEHTQMAFFGYMEGALRSGKSAADQLMMQSCNIRQEPVFTASTAPVRKKMAAGAGRPSLAEAEAYGVESFYPLEEATYGEEARFLDEAFFAEPEEASAYGEQELDARHGKTFYLPIRLNKTVPPKVGVFIPSSFNAAAATAGVDLIVYFHGHMIPDCEKFPKKFDQKGIEYYWNTPLFKSLREELAASGQQVILIAPTLLPFLARSRAGYGNLNEAGKFDYLITETVGQLKAKGALPAGTRVRHIILSGHSGGGLPMLAILAARNLLKKNIAECWGFEGLYFGTNGWATWLKANPNSYFLHFRRPSFKPAETKALKKYPNFKDVADGKSHCGIIRDKWAEAIRISPLLSKRPDAAAAGRPSSNLSALLAGLPRLATLPPAFIAALAKGNRDENQLTNLIFFARHPALRGRKLTQKDPQSLKNEWVRIRQTIVRPALRRLEHAKSQSTTYVRKVQA